jgi:hypothetical protein
LAVSFQKILHAQLLEKGAAIMAMTRATCTTGLTEDLPTGEKLHAWTGPSLSGEEARMTLLSELSMRDLAGGPVKRGRGGHKVASAGL